jgi:hypothetical protein
MALNITKTVSGVLVGLMLLPGLAQAGAPVATVKKDTVHNQIIVTDHTANHAFKTYNLSGSGDHQYICAGNSKILCVLIGAIAVGTIIAIGVNASSGGGTSPAPY